MGECQNATATRGVGVTAPFYRRPAVLGAAIAVSVAVVVTVTVAAVRINRDDGGDERDDECDGKFMPTCITEMTRMTEVILLCY